MTRRSKDTTPVTEDSATREETIRGHLGLVYHVARQLSRARANEVEIDDLVGAGTLGLIEAYEHFDTSRGLAFSTFAAPRIRGAMLDELRRLDRVPRSVRRKTRQIDGVATSLAATLGREPAHAELAEGLGIDLPTFWRWQSECEATRVVRLEQAAAPGNAERTRAPGEWLAGAGGEELDDELTRHQEIEHVRDAVLRLPEQERTVLSLYYFEELKLNDIARILGVSESRVSQIRGKAIERLRRGVAGLRACVA